MGCWGTYSWENDSSADAECNCARMGFNVYFNQWPWVSKRKFKSPPDIGIGQLGLVMRLIMMENRTADFSTNVLKITHTCLLEEKPNLQREIDGENGLSWGDPKKRMRCLEEEIYVLEKELWKREGLVDFLVYIKNTSEICDKDLLKLINSFHNFGDEFVIGRWWNSWKYKFTERKTSSFVPRLFPLSDPSQPIHIWPDNFWKSWWWKPWWWP